MSVLSQPPSETVERGGPSASGDLDEQAPEDEKIPSFRELMPAWAHVAPPDDLQIQLRDILPRWIIATASNVSGSSLTAPPPPADAAPADAAARDAGPRDAVPSGGASTDAAPADVVPGAPAAAPLVVPELTSSTDDSLPSWAAKPPGRLAGTLDAQPPGPATRRRPEMPTISWASLIGTTPASSPDVEDSLSPVAASSMPQSSTPPPLEVPSRPGERSTTTEAARASSGINAPAEPLAPPEAKSKRVIVRFRRIPFYRKPVSTVPAAPVQEPKPAVVDSSPSAPPAKDEVAPNHPAPFDELSRKTREAESKLRDRGSKDSSA
jgi:hypothetical protein